MKKLVISVSILLLILSSLVVAPSVMADADTVTTRTRTTLNANLLNPCNGELVATEAEQFEVIHLTNFQHFHITTNIHGVGTGLTTGAKYQLSAVSTANQNVGGAENQTLWQDFVFTSQGDVPNFLVQLVRHFTINANGEMVVNFTNVFTKCQ